MIPVTRKDKDDLQELKKEVETLKAAKQEVENQQQTKMSDLIKQVKDRKEEEEKKAEVTKKTEEHVHDNDGAFCPTCLGNEHKHKMIPDALGLKYHCTGPECKKEYVMVDKTSDFRCINCNAPIKRPENEKVKLESCPFCNSTRAMKYDWQKLWKLDPHKTKIG